MVAGAGRRSAAARSTERSSAVAPQPALPKCRGQPWPEPAVSGPRGWSPVAGAGRCRCHGRSAEGDAAGRGGERGRHGRHAPLRAPAGPRHGGAAAQRQPRPHRRHPAARRGSGARGPRLRERRPHGQIRHLPAGAPGRRGLQHPDA